MSHFQNKIGGIYKITHLPSEHYYIGMSVSIFNRWHSHYTSLTNKKHSSTAFMELWNNSLATEWQFTILEILNLTDFKLKTGLKGKKLDSAYRKELLRLERYHMSMHSRTYCLNKDDKYFS